MRDFGFVRAESLPAALDAVAAGAVPHGGGTELLNWMRLGIAAPEALVDLSGVEALHGIAVEGDVLRIGALVTLAEAQADPSVRAAAPVLAEACLRAASAQLRNRATLGGNLLQKTRCPYFRADIAGPDRMPWGCNKRQAGSGCDATGRTYSRAALFGATADCVATQPSDPAVALAALDATVEVAGPAGGRRLPVRDFHLTQSEAGSAAVETALAPGEIIVAYHVPMDRAAARSAYLKLRERESYEYAMVSAAACLDVVDGVIASARLAVGSVAQKPWRLPEAEGAVVGLAPGDGTRIRRALTGDLAAARPLDGQEYKIELVGNAVLRAIAMAGGRRA